MKAKLHLIFYLFLGTHQFSLAQTLPDTGISGVYEVMTGVKDAAWFIKYFNEFGFRVVDSASFSAKDAFELYGVNSALKSYRLRNGEIDSHGLLRLLVWEKPIGEGLGYAMPETIGMRMSVMHTKDIIRLVDIYQTERANGEKWLPIEPIFDDLYNLSDKKPDFFNRPVGVRETGVYGEKFNHIFFQRYGYHIPGYGTINPNAALQTSEFTHHDFIIKGKMDEVTRYYSEALGMKPEQKETSIDGDWQAGPRRVFDMPMGYSHYYRGFVSPNNICGKLKFFIPRGQKTDLSENQRIGELGITLHSFYTPKLQMVYDLIGKQGIKPSKILKNEFGEKSFVFRGPDAVSWQIIEKTNPPKNKPVTNLEMKRVNN